ncbi:nuclear transport factor 2 family protein [Variovorax sp. J2P1-59]|uniref:YybH family protein n=1 Tax=Variovorax flavidus TaxID=3053501 RepID=UPI002575D92B|nr:nuclear transport factor 2 family protein [Variovorax sp. J2P1-59]MDM0074092.1 nuclear transport factor 2 family protein [Variovorax sp. J2P1-59]
MPVTQHPELAAVVAELIRKSEQANAALMLGDIRQYLELITHSDDYTLMSPFGGTPTHGPQITSKRWEEIGRFFKNGSLTQELVQSYASTDMVVLATIERAHVEVGGLPAQAWSLRVTLVYRRVGSGWRLAHRHADPLGNGISLEQAAALARDPKGCTEPEHASRGAALDG